MFTRALVGVREREEPYVFCVCGCTCTLGRGQNRLTCFSFCSCWMSVETHLLYAVHGPIMAALLVSLLIQCSREIF